MFYIYAEISITSSTPDNLMFVARVMIEKERQSEKMKSERIRKLEKEPKSTLDNNFPMLI